jgi:hypothetical protein
MGDGGLAPLFGVFVYSGIVLLELSGEQTQNNFDWFDNSFDRIN